MDACFDCTMHSELWSWINLMNKATMIAKIAEKSDLNEEAGGGGA